MSVNRHEPWDVPLERVLHEVVRDRRVHHPNFLALVDRWRSPRGKQQHSRNPGLRASDPARRDSEVLLIGDFMLLAATEHVLAYERRLGGQRVVVVLNMTGQARALPLGNPAYEMLLSTYLDDPVHLKEEEIHLRADEGLVLRAQADVR
jgi:Maltogenic Amylase, C-terminal domain